MTAIDDSENVSRLLATEHECVMSVLDVVRRRRLSIEQSAALKIRRTHDKLREASNTTRIAASDILDGLDRAAAVLDELDAVALAAGEADARPAELRNTLRDELFALMGAMQFQDIASQQLASASTVLAEVEARLADIATALHPPAPVATASLDRQSGLPAAFDPNANMLDREARQAQADDLRNARAKAG